jgi:nicotinamidase-related amidase
MSKQKKNTTDEHSEWVLLIIDMINRFDFPGGKSLQHHALPTAKRISALKEKLKARGVPVIFANDNFGKWKSDIKKVIAYCQSEKDQGSHIIEILQPTDEDYFVLKPMHSAFFATPLDVLLTHLGVKRIILTGLTGSQCVLFTAVDAHMRDYEIYIPKDCVVSQTDKEQNFAFWYFQRILQVDISTSQKLIRKISHIKTS